MKGGKIVIVLVVIALVVWGIYALSKNQERAAGPAKGEPIKFGFIGPLTGDASSIGTVNKAGVEVAVKEVNAEGGVNGRPIEVIYEDGQCNAKTAVNAARKLISVDKTPIIIGGLCSTETSAFGPAAMEAKIIVVSYGSSAPSLSKLGKYFFRSYPSDAFQGKFSAEYAYDILEAKKVAIVYHISEWGTGIKDVFEARFKELGGEIVAVEGAPQEARDYRTILTKIKNVKADLIFAPMYPEGSIVALKQAKELGIKTQFLGADAWGDPKLHKEVSGMGKFIFTEPVTPAPEDFKAKIKAKTGGDEVPIGTSNAYDNVRIAVEALKQVGLGNPDKLADAIRTMEYNGISGFISFDENGDLKRADYVVKEIKDGGAVELETEAEPAD